MLAGYKKPGSTGQYCPTCDKNTSHRLIEPPNHKPGTPLDRECTICVPEEDLLEE